MKEVFLVENQGRTALFAPLRGFIMEVEEDDKEGVVEFISQPQFSFEKLFELFPEIEKDRLLRYEIEVGDTEEKETGFHPDSAVLFTTFDCNLRCVYCYARAGEQRLDMSHELAKSAIDFIVGNAKPKKSKDCSLGFHGGGEPTWNWPVFQFALGYFQEQLRASGLIPKVSLATNGMLSGQQIDWIAKRMDTVQVSLDGMEEIQNSQRPTLAGRGSFAVVSNTVKSFLAYGLKVVIHSVVTERGISSIPEIARFLATGFPGTTIHLEPVFQCGRGLTTGQRFPSPELFVRGFIEAREVAKPFGAEVVYSGGGPRLAELRKNFCGVSDPNFVVTPTGLVTACNEVAELTHPLAKHFIYGYWDRSSGCFVFDHQKIKNLRNYGAEIDPECENCFARFSCAGDCLAKNLGVAGKRSVLSFLNPRCKVNQELMRHYVFDRLISTRKEESGEHASRERQGPTDSSCVSPCSEAEAADCLP